jgi:hypothetical protein
MYSGPSQNPVGFGKSFGKTGLKPAFSPKSKAIFPKTKILRILLYSLIYLFAER